MRLHVLLTVAIKTSFFWYVTPCSVVAYSSTYAYQTIRSHIPFAICLRIFTILNVVLRVRITNHDAWVKLLGVRRSVTLRVVPIVAVIIVQMQLPLFYAWDIVNFSSRMTGTALIPIFLLQTARYHISCTCHTNGRYLDSTKVFPYLQLVPHREYCLHMTEHIKVPKFSCKVSVILPRF
jgi:hypothetical protein